MTTAFLAQTDAAMEISAKVSEHSNEEVLFSGFINSWIGVSFDDSDDKSGNGSIIRKGE